MNLYSPEQIETVLLAVPLTAYSIQRGYGITEGDGLLAAREAVAKHVRHGLERLTPDSEMLSAQLQQANATAADAWQQFSDYRKRHENPQPT